ncbi:tetratricopeptide repeat protein [Frankia sp. CNm7]|uniref:Tetratricopeptide repeat protein n=1 Tax=Frankia nepalensis TaxID=1836974 RepID=A0A937RRX3_9ACTN|nr:tetratricopeptide repeat protein [Frankia nepalensis]MBL7502344.1 tetratricopeptide repeat protein [Frankia nepalensis]MBL7517983.1 tetratricopeptide repeat protein [Frankia nepalensis]MBL7633769.1 tetratricopeptide repeat protein [Frankia nepalensis]
MLTDDDVDQIVIKAAGDGRHNAAAARLEELAEKPELHAGEINRASLLVDAGGQHGLAGDWDAAIRCYQEAIAAGDCQRTDPRVWLHDALLRTGRPDEASGLLRELKAVRSQDPDLYAAVAESLEMHGLLADAHTWFTMGYHRCENADVPEFMLDLLLVGRRRVRHSLGYPTDELDELADDYLDAVAD